MTNVIITDIENAFKPVETLVEGVGTDFTTALVNAMKQLPQLILDVIEAAVPAVVATLAGSVAGPAGAVTAASIAAAVEDSAIQTLSTQGVSIADADLAAFKGAVLATVVNAQSATPAPAAVSTAPAAS
jgi:hypothetical protein